jgi:hypothetical protein
VRFQLKNSFSTATGDFTHDRHQILSPVPLSPTREQNDRDH